MPSIQIKGVSAQAHAVLRRRAAAEHQSLQEYLRTRLEAEAAQLDRAGSRAGGSLTLTEAVDAVRDYRDRR